MADKYEPVAGDVTTEPVATAAQSARAGTNRVGPITVAQDSSAKHYTPDGVKQIAPGQEVPADVPAVDGRIELPTSYDEFGHDVSQHKASADRVHRDEVEKSSSPAASAKK